jgi:hypothetical protein
MYPVLLAMPTWLQTHESLAIWLEGIALVLIFIWDRIDSRQQHKEMLQQMEIMQSHANATRDNAIAAKDAAEAAKANAEAARLNAQAVIDTERPWIVITIHPHPSTSGNFVFRATNKGRTPAEFESGDSTFCFDSYPDNLRTPPTYSSPFVAPNQTLMVQGDGFDIQPAGVNPESMIRDAGMTERMKIGNQFLLFYGRIIYRNVFGRDGKDPVRHETRWCYCFDVFRGEFVRSGSAEYNRYA